MCVGQRPYFRGRSKTRGCAPSLAAGSALTELVEGKHKAALILLTRDDVENAVGGLSNESKHAACESSKPSVLREQVVRAIELGFFDTIRD